MKDYSKIPTIELIKMFSHLKNKIELMMLEYNNMLEELIKRYPDLENEDSLKVRK